MALTEEQEFKFYDDERVIGEQNFDLIEKLKRIPHLDLEVPIELEILSEEIKIFTEWFPHRLSPALKLPPEVYIAHEEKYRGQCLHDIQSDSRIGMIDAINWDTQAPEARVDEIGRLYWGPTNAGIHTPRLIQNVGRICSYINRIRLFNTGSGKGLTWHSHHNGVYSSKNYSLAFVVIPLQTHQDCIHSIRDFRNKNGFIYKKNYEAGKAYMFNSWHDHEFFNGGNIDRISIVANFRIRSHEFLNLVRPLVNKYSGPLIDI